MRTAADLASKIPRILVPKGIDGEWYVKTRDRVFVLRFNLDTREPVWAQVGFYEEGADIQRADDADANGT